MQDTPPRIGIIGAGRLGAMLARAFARYRPGAPLHLATRNAAAAAALARDLPAMRQMTMEVLAAESDVVLLAVPPEAYPAVIGIITPFLAPSAILVSLTNGIALDTLGQLAARPIVKIIPTMAHAEGRGVALVIRGPAASMQHVGRVRACFAGISSPMVIGEEDSRAASNIAGSSLAFVARFAEALIAAHAGRTRQVDPAQLTAMMAETLAAVGVLMQAGHPPGSIVAATATPGGVTEAGLRALEARLPALAADIVNATYARQHAMQAQLA